MIRQPMSRSRKATPLQINSLLLATAAPPIPEAKAWAAAYDGAAGPLIDLSQAVPGYPPHPGMLRRLGEAAATREAAAYGDIVGDAELRRVYAAHVADLYGAEVGAEDVAITAGCNQAFYVVMIALAKAGDAVILPSPWYFNHKMTLDMLGIEALALPCRAEAGFVPEVEEAEPLIGPRVRAIVLVSPNNPTGAAYPPAVVAAFHALAAHHGIALVVDETYRDFVDSGSHPHDCLAMPGWRDTLVQLYSFSKAYCIPGHRAGAMIAGPRFLGEVAKILDCLQICAPRTPQLVLPWAIAALRDWRASNRTEILARVAAFRQAIAGLPGWEIGSIGAYFAYLKHPYEGCRGSDICEWLARQRGVLALPGSYFGPRQHGFLRVAFANVDAAAMADIPARLAVEYPGSRQGLGRTAGAMRL
jgi:aspartate/methionine/tyrosine aminotransferase